MSGPLRWIIAITALVVLVLPDLALAQERPLRNPQLYRPGVGDLMTMTVQPRHIKLGLAGRESNWPYAAYALHELEEAFERTVAVWPTWETFSLDQMMGSVTEPMAALDKAIKAGNSDQFAKAYDQLTKTCNSCHQSTNRGMIVIQTPASSSFPDQDFRLPPK